MYLCGHDISNGQARAAAFTYVFFFSRSRSSGMECRMVISSSLTCPQIIAAVDDDLFLFEGAR